MKTKNGEIILTNFTCGTVYQDVVSYVDEEGMRIEIPIALIEQLYKLIEYNKTKFEV